LALGRLYAGQANLKMARETYEQLARSDFGSIGQEAAMYLEELLREHPELAMPEPSQTNALPTTLLQPAGTMAPMRSVPSETNSTGAVPVQVGTNAGAQ
jgi:hypothetical protein